MFQKIKNFFLFMFEKRIFCLVSIFIFLNLFLLPLPVSAGIWEKLANLPLTIPSVWTALIFWIIAEITALFAVFGNIVLNWVLSPGFTELPYTKPGPLPDGNPIIEAGLSITQGFVNMLLVLVLVYIAIATILRLAGYETKKLLITFIVIALLVNFSPVLCGLIVDASNIVMNFFIKGIGEAGGTTLLNKFSNIAKVFGSGFLDAMFDFRLMAGKIMQLAVIAVANFLLFLILVLFAVIFIARYIFIWILVILSPLAFACYILPATRKYWTMWWEQFIQWSIIGITCSFFLYLGMTLANLPSNTFGQPTGLATAVLPHLVSIAFLFIGLIFGLQTSAMGASAITSFGKKQINALGSRSGEFAKGKAKEIGAAIREKMPVGVKKFAERMATAPRWGEGQAGVGGFAKRLTSAPMYYARRTVGLGLQQTVGEEGDKARIEMGQSSVKETDSEADILSRYHRAITKTEKIGILNKAVEFGKMKNLMDEDKFKKGAIKKPDIESLMPMAKKLNFDKKLNSAFPTIARDLLKDTDKEVIQTNQDQEFIEAQKKMPDIDAKTWAIVNKLKPNDFKNMQESEFLEDVKTQDVFLAAAMGSHLSQLVEGMGKKAVLTLEKRTKELSKGSGKSPNDWLKDLNPRLHKSLTSGPSRGLINLSDTKENTEQSKTIITDTSQTTFKESKKSSEHQDPKGRTASGAPKDNIKPPQGRKL